jgi:hypothetical protein
MYLVGWRNGDALEVLSQETGHSDRILSWFPVYVLVNVGIVP